MAAAEKAPASYAIRLFGRVAADETRVFTLNAAVEGNIRTVSSVTTGSHVRKGQLLASFFSYDTRTPMQAYIGKRIPLAGVAHQNGTCRFGTDPATSVLDVNCKAHELDNLYVVDGSFFASSSAVNPALTIAANALRVAEHLKQRLGATTEAAVGVAR